jgi:hypothetical protein
MTTLNNLIDDIQLDLQGFTYRQDRATYLTQPCTSGDLVIHVASTDNIGKGIIEINDEMLWVDSYDRQANTVTISPYGRSYNASVADPAGYPSGTKVTITPTFPRVAVKRAINDTLNQVYPTVFATGRSTFNFLASRTTYDIPAEAIQILSMTWQTVGPTREWLPVRQWRWDALALVGGSSYATTGKTVSLYDNILPGRTVNVIYAKLPSQMTNMSDDFEAVTGLPSSMRDVIVYGASYRLSSYIDPARVSITSPASDEIDTKRPYGTGVNITKQLYSLYQQRLQEESLKQKQQYPVRVHYSR